MMTPKANIGTIRSRLRRKGDLRLKKHNPDSFSVLHPFGTVIAGPFTRAEVEQWSWDYLRGPNHGE